MALTGVSTKAELVREQREGADLEAEFNGRYPLSI